MLIPELPYKKFIVKNNFNKSSIKIFAKQINIHPGIVVGRLQHDGHLPYSYNKERAKYEWVTPNQKEIK